MELRTLLLFGLVLLLSCEQENTIKDCEINDTGDLLISKSETFQGITLDVSVYIWTWNDSANLYSDPFDYFNTIEPAYSDTFVLEIDSKTILNIPAGTLKILYNQIGSNTKRQIVSGITTCDRTNITLL